MKYCNIENFDKTCIVKAFYTLKDSGRWRIYSYDILDNMKDLKHFNELGENFGITPSNMVRVMQEHTDNVYLVKKEDAGLGVIKHEPDISYDGLITNQKNILLLTVEADCTPVYILDPVNRAIGMVHSGWRGTVKRIAIKALEMMKHNFGTDKSDVLIHFGPAICGKCYEVGKDLISEFEKVLDNNSMNAVFTPKVGDDNKLTLDVTKAIEIMLLEYGIKKENITRTDICTFHDDIVYSWRRDHDKTKQMLTGIMLID